MSVLDRSYRRWEGAPTSYVARMLVIPRFALATTCKSKLVLFMLTVCFLPNLILGILVYLSSNLATIKLLVPALNQLAPAVAGLARPGDIVLTLGAGSIGSVARAIVRELETLRHA